MPLRRISLQAAVAGTATAFALISAWHSGPHVWNRISDDYRTYSAYSDEQRKHAVLDQIPLPSDVFDFYADRVGRGDRVYFQVLESGFSTWDDLPTAVSTAGRYYLLPATATGDLEDATVVVSYHADPNELPVRYLTQVQAGLQPIYVSRISAP